MVVTKHLTLIKFSLSNLLAILTIFVQLGFPRISGAADSAAFKADRGSVFEVATAQSPMGFLAATWAKGTFMQSFCAVSVSVDKGNSWTRPNLYRNPKYLRGINPAVAIGDNGTTYSVCMSDGGDRSDIAFSRSLDKGNRWSTWTVIADKKNGMADKPAIIAGAKGEVIVSYTDVDYKSGRSKLKVIRSRDTGKTWSTPIEITNESHPHQRGSFIGDQGSSFGKDQLSNIYITWAEYYGPVFISISKDGGKTFGGPIRVADENFAPPLTQVLVSPNGKNVLVAWYNAHTFDKPVRMAVSHDEGQTWSLPIQLSNHGGLASLTLDSTNTPQIIWTEKEEQNDNLKMSLVYASLFNWEEQQILIKPVLSWMTNRPTHEDANYIGDYQSLVSLDNSQLLAFWLDYNPTGTKVQQSLIPVAR